MGFDDEFEYNNINRRPINRTDGEGRPNVNRMQQGQNINQGRQVNPNRRPQGQNMNGRPPQNPNRRVAGQQYNNGNSRTGRDNTVRNMKRTKVSKKQRQSEFFRALIPTIVAIFLIVTVVIVALNSGLFDSLKYSSDRKDLYSYLDIADNNRAVIIDNGALTGESMFVKDGHVYIPVTEVLEKYSDRFYYDSETDAYLYTRGASIDKAVIGETSFVFNNNTEALECAPIIKQGDDHYMALDFLKKYYNLSYELYGGDTEPYRMNIKTEWGTVKKGVISEDTSIRETTEKKSSIIEDLKGGDTVEIIENEGEWTKVCASDLLFGYIETKYLRNVHDETLTPVNDVATEVIPDSTRSFPINLTWNNVASIEGNSQINQLLATAHGVNVISPTWFTVSDDNGTIDSIGSKAYVNTCHAKGVEVWGLFDNIQHLEVSSFEIFSKASKRANMINQLLSYVDKYGLDGLNMDIESIPSESGPHYVQFLRELSIECRKRGIVLSVDNYVPQGYNDFFNRKEQGIFCDYVIIMGYDEHFTSSLESGSVASLPFVRAGIEKTLEEVPANKIINAVPLYTRLWTETPKTEAELAAERGNIEESELEAATVTQEEKDALEESIIPYTLEVQTIPMGEGVKSVNAAGVTAKWDEETGQNYAEWKKGQKTVKIWLEDRDSLKAKLDVMKENNLAGVASWQMAFAEDYVWDLLSSYY